MKIAICSSGNTSNSKVSNRFARCNYFMIYDNQANTSTFVDNSAKGEPSGAGGKATKNLSDLDVDVVLVPQLGPKAYDALHAFDISAYEYQLDITIEEALKQYKENAYSQVTVAKGMGKH